MSLLILFLFLTKCISFSLGFSGTEEEALGAWGAAAGVSATVKLWENEEDREKNCPNCRSAVTAHLHDQPHITAAQVCSELPDSVRGLDGASCVDNIAYMIEERQLALFYELGQDLDAYLEEKGVDLPGVEGKVSHTPLHSRRTPHPR